MTGKYTSPGESTEVISKLMRWTDDRQIHIHTILHQNKNDEHARGHVGTELNNKAETIMQIEADKDDKSISVVEALHIRDREFESFAFRINDECLPETVEFYQPQKRQAGRPSKEPFDPYKEIPENMHRSALNAAFEGGNINSYDNFLERLKEGYGRQGIKLGHNKAVKIATFLNNKRMVVKEGKNTGSTGISIIRPMPLSSIGVTFPDFTLLPGCRYENKAKRWQVSLCRCNLPFPFCMYARIRTTPCYLRCVVPIHVGLARMPLKLFRGSLIPHSPFGDGMCAT